MAFADDMVLLADAPLEMQPIIDRTVAFMESKGMEVNPTKCAAICNTNKEGRIITSNRPIFKVKSELIQPITEINSFKYLGQHFSSTGANKPSLATLPIWLNRIQRSPLKPQQKLFMLNTYIIPKLLYGLQTSKVTRQILKTQIG